MNDEQILALKELGNFKLNDINSQLRKISLLETAYYVKENLLFKKSFRSTKDIQKHCIDQVVLEDGLFLEFGVYKGTSINFISSLIPDKKIYGFDSFEGLPEAWVPSRPKGYFSTDGKLPEVNKNTTLVKGFFDKSIPEFKKTEDYQQCDSIAFLHVDCDLYSATKTILNELKEKIKPGTVILFDEYFNYIGWQHHE